MRRGREKSSLEGTRVHRIKNKISLRKGETNGISQTYLLSKQQQSEGRENVILQHFFYLLGPNFWSAAAAAL